MEQAVSTRVATAVVDPAAARFLLDPERIRFVRPFMTGERSTAAAAGEVGVSVKDMAYRVKRMLALGLITCTHERKRAGRPVRLYRAPSAFFIPFASVPEGDLGDMLEALLRGPQRRLVGGFVRTLSDTERNLHRWGWRLELDPAERVSIRPSGDPEDDEPLFRRLLEEDGPAVYMANLPLRLSHADAKSLQRELLELVGRYDGRDGSDSYMLTLGLTPLDED
ncbi:MAG: hypothetical protein P8Y02_04285 [Deinococcales bacterium]|jgi:hypothetical protein